jgi:hypothetical protein
MEMPPDPQEQENWLELSKQYDHLREYSPDGINPRSETTTKSGLLFNVDKYKWLRQQEGLTHLKTIWLAAFNSFSKNDEAGAISVERWRKGITIASIQDEYDCHEEAHLELDTTQYPDYYTQLFDGLSSLSVGELEQRQAFERDPSNYVVGGISIQGIVVTIYIAIQGKDVANEWTNLDEKQLRTLKNYIWKSLVAAFPELSIDDPSGQYSDVSDVPDYFEIKLTRVGSQPKLKELIGMGFNDLFGILHPKPTRELPPGSRELQRPYIEKGYLIAPVEKNLATFLVSSGYLVILEPKLFLPSPEAETFRNPDLLVIDKGRAVVVEIDDTTHLVDHDNNRAPNVKKWKRDRLIDRELLCSGIPVLRVWHEEARETPEKVLTRIVQILESLGGGRLRYQ